MSESPIVANKEPYAVEVEKGETYYWCSCGKSDRQPYCDGSHKGSAFSPVPFTADKSGIVYLCGCKQTKAQPHCDGTHSKI